MKVTVSLQERNGIYQAVLSYKDKNNKRQQKWKSTGLTIRGNKKIAMQKAEDLRAEFESELNFKGTSIDSKKVSNEILFLDYMKNWLKIVRHSIEPSTYTSYSQIVDARITKYFTIHKIKLVELEPIHIQEFYNSMLKEGLTANTVIHHHAIIRKSLDYAFKMNLIPCNPADKIQRPKKEMFIGSFYSEQELNLLFEKSEDDTMELAIILSSFYGLRRSEVLGLKWDAFDFNNKTITIKHTIIEAILDGKRQIIGKDRTKNKSSYRTLPLVDDVIEVLQKYQAKQKQNKELCKKGYNQKYLDYICVTDIGDIIKPGFIT